MKFGIKNLGPIKEANIELGDLTIICGKNNCGKTYLTYTLYAFLHEIKRNFILSDFADAFETCYKEGCSSLNISYVKQNFNNSLLNAMTGFIKHIPELLAINPSTIVATQCLASLDDEEFEIFKKTASESKFQVTEKCSFSFKKEKESEKIDISLENTGYRLPRKENLRKLFNFVCSLFINKVFPDVFSLTGERSGIAIFGDDIAEFSRKMKNETTIQFTKLRQKIVESVPESNSKFPLPITQELAFFQNIKVIRRRSSYIASEHHEILDLADNISGGHYDFDDYSGIQYFPVDSNSALNLIESSSSVKSLVEFSFYLRHCAKKNQILMIDEPELNLHPENQRKLARLLAMLVNAGIKVFITTHSDYIIKEFNTLLMLNYKDDPRMEEMQKKYSYSEAELLDADKVRVYCAQDGNVLPVTASQDSGIAISSFDDTIRQMVYMQRDILMGGTPNA